MARDGYLWNAGEDTIHTPQKEQKPLSPKEKRKNFWYYHRFHILIAVVCALALGWAIHEFTSRVTPDYGIALMTYDSYPDSVIKQMENEMATLAEDRNGDGKVVVRVNYYHLFEENTADANGYLANAAKMQGDILVGDSMLFLIDDKSLREYCAEDASMFTYQDGSTPADGASDLENLGQKWKTVPFLASLDLKAPAYSESGEVVTVDYQEALADINVCMRAMQRSNLEGKADKEKANADTWALLRKMQQQS